MLTAFTIWAAVTGTLGAVMAFARIGLDEAVSNLSKWLEKAGIPRIPQWLRERSVDRWVLRYGSLVMAGLLFVGGMVFQSWWSKPAINVQSSPITARSQTDAAPPSPTRDPDGIYQLGRQVGTVELPEVDESKSTISFRRIVGAVNFNPNQDFEYRDYILHIRGISAEAGGDFSGQRIRALWDVRTDIVARR
jgi:hypothetical protein